MRAEALAARRAFMVDFVMRAIMSTAEIAQRE